MVRSTPNWYQERFTYLVVCSLVLVLLQLPAATEEQQAPGRLLFSVIVVDELVPKPVPLVDFQITARSGPPGERLLRTDEEGKFVIDLPAGEYEIISAKPLKYKGRSMSWSRVFKVESGQDCVLKLTDSDASQSAAGKISDTFCPRRMS